MPPDAPEPAGPAAVEATGAPTRRERKRDRTARHIAATAWALFEQHGFEAVTMEAVAEAADVAKGTLYKHFPVKEALLRDAMHGEFVERLPTYLARLAALPGPLARLDAFVQGWVEWMLTRREAYGHYLRYRMMQAARPAATGGDQRSGVDRVLAGFLAEAQAAGECRTDIDADALADLLQALMLGALLRGQRVPTRDLRDEFRIALDMFRRGAQAALVAPAPPPAPASAPALSAAGRPGRA